MKPIRPIAGLLTIGTLMLVARAGVRAGDVIVAFGGTAVRRAGELPGLTARTPAGSDVDVSVVRDGREQTVKVRLGELPRP